TLTFDRHALISAGDLLPLNRPRPAPERQRVPANSTSTAAQESVGLVPQRTGLRRCALPHNPNVRDLNNYTWSPAKPHKITSRDEAQIDYPNADHPEDQSVTAINRLGEPVTYPFHRADDGR